MARAIDLIGGSSYLWHWKHNVLHHSYPNVHGADDDIDLGLLGRLAPAQKWLPFHRFQQYYMWALYGAVPFKWHLWDDFVELAAGKIGTQTIPRPKGKELVVLIAGKLVFYSLAFVIPALFHPLWVVLLYYVAISFTLGVLIGTVFQLAHCVAEAEFSLPAADTNRMEAEWAVHQVESTVDFSRGNPVITWFLGGLNYQIEHHLFPKVSHIHYPSLAPIVESVCRKFGVSYNAHESLGGAMASHFRWLKVMGQPA
jgi:linoleoyl-CoA desaturase